MYVNKKIHSKYFNSLTTIIKQVCYADYSALIKYTYYGKEINKVCK